MVAWLQCNVALAQNTLKLRNRLRHHFLTTVYILLANVLLTNYGR